MTKPNILVVDSDEGFGFMLTEGLQNSGQYVATCVHSGADALHAVVEHSFDLVIVDIALTDMHPAKLIQAIRDAKSDTKIMLIPLIGQDLPANLKDIKIDGVLPKPFFVGDLPELVDKALGRTRQRILTPDPVSLAKMRSRKEPSGTYPVPPPAADTTTPETQYFAQTAQPPLVPQETVRFLRASENEILRLLRDLNREVRAEAILLVAGTDLIAQAGILSREECEELTVLVAHSTQTAAQAAAFLGERAGRFTQSLHEGAAYRLYTLTLAEGILLSLALSTNVPLGMIRHQSRQIADQLSRFII
ncbi:MAG: response regulator [Chloroflexi bacterium]|nr:MAG: response regulator [Chloroflexota bacterium]